MSMSLHARFLILLPRIEAVARFRLRCVRCLDHRGDQIAETIALAWKWFLRLEERGKDASKFVTPLATYAARAIRSGRRLVGMEKSKDVLSPWAQQRGGFKVGAIGDEQESLLFADALKDNSQTPPPEAATLRIDFPRWRRRRSRRDRHVMNELAMGERTQKVARRHRLSPARVSQLRREFHDDWQRFCEPQAAGQRIHLKGSISERRHLWEPGKS